MLPAPQPHQGRPGLPCVCVRARVRERVRSVYGLTHTPARAAASRVFSRLLASSREKLMT